MMRPETPQGRGRLILLGNAVHDPRQAALAPARARTRWLRLAADALGIVGVMLILPVLLVLIWVAL